MANPYLPGPIRTADITHQLEHPIETRAEDGTPLLVRTLFISYRRTDDRANPWAITSLQASAARPAPKVGGYSSLFRKTADFVLTDELQQLVDRLTKLMRDNAR